MPVIGTAGHVDHGKSTLVQALTGRDPDRWDEEKERGLTIDLGFAWSVLPSGIEVGFVDVPGHERFIKNMLAGVDAVSVALFVVAADEGWMPQSEEHLAILDLLGVDRGVVALTRADLVDDDTLELAALEIDERLEGTTLAGSPVIPTAAIEGRGLDELRIALDSALSDVVVPDVGRPRMWIDRSFSISGAGTVVTGTLIEGSLNTDDPVVILPDGLAGRIRSLQSHERTGERVEPGNRAAVNVVGIDREEVRRGAMLGAPGQWALSRRFTAAVRTVRGLDAPLRERGSFHIHLGSGAWPARLRILGSDEVSARGRVVVELAEPLPVRWGDRFILREVGRRAVVAGGRVLDPTPPRRLRSIVASADLIAAARTPDEAATALLEMRGRAEVAQLSAETGGGGPGRVASTGTIAYSPTRIAELLDQAGAAVDAFHADNPLRPGIPKASLAGHLGVGTDELDDLLAMSDELETSQAAVTRRGRGVVLTDAQEDEWKQVRQELEAAGPTPPRRSELRLTTELEHALVRRGDLVTVSEDLLYLPSTLADVVARTRQLSDGFTVADFRDHLAITRKHAIPLLEWMDATGVTSRDGDGRRVRPEPA